MHYTIINLNLTYTMKKSIILLIMITAATTLFGQQADEKTKKELEKLSWDWMNAWKARDTVFIEKIMAPEYRLLALINGELISMKRADWLATVKYYVPDSFRYYDFDIRVYGETAVVQSKFEQQATLHGKDRSGTFQVTDVWVKNKKGWQVVHRHTTLKPK